MRLQWFGMYHDKPKIGTFMMRVKIPSGILSPAGLAAIGEISELYGRDQGELTTRQNIQLHYITLDRCPEIFERLKAAGLTTMGGCGDVVRNITGCPVAGVDHDELFDTTGLVAETANFFTAIASIPICRASTKLRSRRAAINATRPRSTASRWSG